VVLYSGNTKRRNTQLTTATHDKIYDFLFNLPCLLQRTVDYTILFSLFLHSGHDSQIVVMRLVGGFFFYSTANSFGELRLGGFFSRKQTLCQTDAGKKSFDHAFDQLLHDLSISSNCKPVFSNWKIRFLLVATIL
jgi:hypothetical protein